MNGCVAISFHRMLVKHITWLIFTPRNKTVHDIDVKIHGVSVERVYATKFLGVIVDSKLTWKPHVEYICKKLSKCAGTRRNMHRSSLITLYYTFAYPYFIYCNHVWGNNYASPLEKIKIIQKRLVRTIICSHYRAHTEPLFYANKLLNVCDINSYTICIFMYQFGRHFSDDIFKSILSNENVWIAPNISSKFLPKFRINNFQSLVQIMAWRPGDKPFYEPMMVNLLTHICITRLQRVKDRLYRIWKYKLPMLCIYNIKVCCVVLNVYKATYSINLDRVPEEISFQAMK